MFCYTNVSHVLLEIMTHLNPMYFVCRVMVIECNNSDYIRSSLFRFDKKQPTFGYYNDIQQVNY